MFFFRLIGSLSRVPYVISFLNPFFHVFRLTDLISSYLLSLLYSSLFEILSNNISFSCLSLTCSIICVHMHIWTFCFSRCSFSYSFVLPLLHFYLHDNIVFSLSIYTKISYNFNVSFFLHHNLIFLSTSLIYSCDFSNLFRSPRTAIRYW